MYSRDGGRRAGQWLLAAVAFLLSYIYLWTAMNKWMPAFLSRSVFQKADIMLLLHRRTEYNGCSESTLSNRLAHFSVSISALPVPQKEILSRGR